MRFQQSALAAMIAAAMTLAACSGDDGLQGPQGDQGLAGEQGPQGEQGEAGEDATSSTIHLSFLGRHAAGVFDKSAAEIVDFDAATKQAFVVNADSGKVDVVDATNPASPSLDSSWNVAADVASAINGLAEDDLGAANSLSVQGGYVAVAIEADTKQDNGYIAFYKTDGSFVTAVEAGALPDMVTFTPDGNKVLAANEGEPNGDYSVDPDGTVTVVDVSGGIESVTQANVTTVVFADDVIAEDVRISAKAASNQADLEPEYIAVSADSSKAFVILQENNAVATLDLSDNSVVSVVSLGFKDFSIPGNELDASNSDDVVNIRNWPVFGTYMPDGADTFEFNGTTYLVTANEGDGREYLTDEVDEAACTAAGGFDFDDGDCFHYLDEIRIKDLEDNGAELSDDVKDRIGFDFDDNSALGRLKVITNLGTDGACASLATTGQPEADCTYEALYSFGARSFTIWNTETMQPTFDSGSDFEVVTANLYGVSHFNASNDDNEGDDRSDDKGPEPEAVEIAEIEGNTYAFVALERVGGIMVYHIQTPSKAEFVQYINERDFTSGDVEADLATVGDLGPEAMKFVSASDSPTGTAMLIVGNEVSGTTTFFDVSVIKN